MPNADADGLQLAKTLKTFTEVHKQLLFCVLTGKIFSFIILMLLLGIFQAVCLKPLSFKIPTINIAIVKKELKAESVIDCEAAENIQY